MAGKKGKGSKEVSEKGGSSSGSDQKETVEYLQLKITDLSEKLSRSQQKADSLLSQNAELTRELSVFNADKQDIVEYLQIKITENEQMISKLESKISEFEQDRIKIEKDHQGQIKVINDANTTQVEKLLVELLALKQELAEVSRFSSEKEELYNQLKTTKALLEKKDIEYREAVHGLERKVLQDKTQIKREMLQKINEAVASFRKVADQQMAETTKRSIRENMSISAQLKRMSQKTVQLINENDTLKQKLNSLKLQNSLLASSEKELALKSISYQKTIKMMYQKLKESDQILELAFEENALIHEQVENMQPGESLNQSVEILTEEMKAEIANLQDDYNQLVERISAIHLVGQDLEFLMKEANQALVDSNEADVVEYLEVSLGVITKRLSNLTDFDEPFDPNETSPNMTSKGNEYGELPRVSEEENVEADSERVITNDGEIIYRSIEELQDCESIADLGNMKKENIIKEDEVLTDEKLDDFELSITDDSVSQCSSLTSSSSVRIEHELTPRGRKAIRPQRQIIEETLNRIVRGPNAKPRTPQSKTKTSGAKKDASVQTNGLLFAQKINTDYLLGFDLKPTHSSDKKAVMKPIKTKALAKLKTK